MKSLPHSPVANSGHSLISDAILAGDLSGVLSASRAIEYVAGLRLGESAVNPLTIRFHGRSRTNTAGDMAVRHSENDSDGGVLSAAVFARENVGRFASGSFAIQSKRLVVAEGTASAASATPDDLGEVEEAILAASGDRLRLDVTERIDRAAFDCFEQEGGFTVALPCALQPDVIVGAASEHAAVRFQATRRVDAAADIRAAARYVDDFVDAYHANNITPFALGRCSQLFSDLTAAEANQ